MLNFVSVTLFKHVLLSLDIDIDTDSDLFHAFLKYPLEIVCVKDDLLLVMINK